MVRDDLIEALSARFPMIPDAVIVALTSDAMPCESPSPSSVVSFSYWLGGG